MDDLIKRLKANEGFKARVYQCSEGYDTIGYGSTIKDLKISEEVATILLEERVAEIFDELEKRADWITALPVMVQGVIVEMCYQMGVSGFLKFKKTISLFKQRNFEKASVEMLDSLWAKQTPNRARRLSKIVANEV